jgi:hypothetical protein
MRMMNTTITILLIFYSSFCYGQSWLFEDEEEDKKQENEKVKVYDDINIFGEKDFLANPKVIIEPE